MPWHYSVDVLELYDYVLEMFADLEVMVMSASSVFLVSGLK
jgi:hypothetical protein